MGKSKAQKRLAAQVSSTPSSVKDSLKPASDPTPEPTSTDVQHGSHSASHAGLHALEKSGLVEDRTGTLAKHGPHSESAEQSNNNKSQAFEAPKDRDQPQPTTLDAAAPCDAQPSTAPCDAAGEQQQEQQASTAQPNVAAQNGGAPQNKEANVAPHETPHQQQRPQQQQDEAPSAPPEQANGEAPAAPAEPAQSQQQQPQPQQQPQKQQEGAKPHQSGSSSSTSTTTAPSIGDTPSPATRTTSMDAQPEAHGGSASGTAVNRNGAPERTAAWGSPAADTAPPCHTLRLITTTAPASGNSPKYMGSVQQALAHQPPGSRNSPKFVHTGGSSSSRSALALHATSNGSSSPKYLLPISSSSSSSLGLRAGLGGAGAGGGSSNGSSRHGSPRMAAHARPLRSGDAGASRANGGAGRDAVAMEGGAAAAAAAAAVAYVAKGKDRAARTDLNTKALLPHALAASSQAVAAPLKQGARPPSLHDELEPAQAAALRATQGLGRPLPDLSSTNECTSSSSNIS